jgi:hypothetical protein
MIKRVRLEPELGKLPGRAAEIGLDHPHAVSQSVTPRVLVRKTDELRDHLDQYHLSAGNARCNGKTGGADAGANIKHARPAGVCHRHRRGEQHRVEASPIARCRLQQMKAAAEEGVVGRL